MDILMFKISQERTSKYDFNAGILKFKIVDVKEKKMTDGKIRSNIKIGLRVSIILKQDQRTGKLTEGVVAQILTNSQTHQHGIKVRLETGEVGRVATVL
jgi:uncharacterized repeat protein (TIGR03833 family)